MGQPTPPIAFGAPAGDLSLRLDAAQVAVDDSVMERLRSACAAVVIDEDALAEAGRDWWPLAMAWALDGQLPGRPSAIARPSSAPEVAAVLAVCNEARVPVTAAGGRSGVCGASVPVHGGVVLDTTGMAGIVAVDDDSLILDVLPGT